MKQTPLFVAFLFAISCATSSTTPSATTPASPEVTTKPSAQSSAPDRVTADPATADVLLENDCVRVQFHNVAVGQMIPMHSHPKYVIYVFNPYSARSTFPDGTQRISERKAGEVIWNEPVTHSLENIGTTPIRNLVVEIRSSGKCQ